MNANTAAAGSLLLIIGSVLITCVLVLLAEKRDRARRKQTMARHPAGRSLINGYCSCCRIPADDCRNPIIHGHR